MLTAMTTEQLQNLDATAGIAGFSTRMLMERSGQELSRFLMGKVKKEESILFLCGPGHNGGDGLAAARHLTNNGYRVSVLLSSAPQSSVIKEESKILDVMHVPLLIWDEEFSFTPYDILVDCLLGHSQVAEPKGNIKHIISGAQGKRVYACDIPTGVNNDTGEVYATHLVAEATLSLVAPKKAFSEEKARKVCGDITIVGIGIPAIIYEQVGIDECLVEGETTYPLKITMELSALQERVKAFDEQTGFDKTEFSAMMEMFEEEIGILKAHPDEKGIVDHQLTDLLILVMQIAHRYQTNFDRELADWFKKSHKYLKKLK